MISLAVLLAAAQPAVAPVTPTPPRTPARWTLVDKSFSCALERDLGDAAIKLFSFHVLPGSGRASLVVHDYPGETVAAREPVTVTLGGSNVVVAATGRSAQIAPESPVAFVILDLPEDFVESASRATAIKLAVRGKAALDAPLGDLKAAYASLRTCTDAKLKLWGIDPVARAALRSRPEPVAEISTWVLAHDYPGEALRNEWVGRVLVRLDVDAAGAIAGCASLASSGHPVLDTQSCASLTARGRFVAARDAVGRPTPASHVTLVHWTLAE